MELLTGFKFDKAAKMDKQVMKFSGTPHPFIKDSRNAEEEFFFAPVFSVKPEKGVSILATAGKYNVAAVRETEYGTSVYTLVPPTPELLRSICREKNIHLYCETGDVIRANRSVVMLHTSTEGEKVVDLPWNTPTREVVSGKIYPAGKVRLNMKSGHTAIFVKQP